MSLSGYENVQRYWDDMSNIKEVKAIMCEWEPIAVLRADLFSKITLLERNKI